MYIHRAFAKGTRFHMSVALVGVAQSGKSSILTAVAGAGLAPGAGSAPDTSRADQPHAAMVKVPDQRLQWLADLYQPKKVTPAEIELLDLPGFDLSTQAGRNRAKTHWAAMRQSDMLIFVLRAFEEASVPPYRGRIDPKADLEELLAEMLFADLEQVTSRIKKLEAAARKPTAARDEHLRELELMKRLSSALQSDKSIAEAIAGETEAKLIRSFAFLSQKPSLAVLNCAENALGEPAAEQMASLKCIRLSAGIEAEIAQLDQSDRTDFMADLGITSPARDRLLAACYQGLNLVSFLTFVSDECRAWTIPAGTEAVAAAGKIHSDMARGFIRAETVAFDDLRSAGDMKAAKAAGKVRLEGKSYIVRDGDVINFRFNV